jgi:NAD(P)-dependent dehydrogenase (short-subunit alcohol dehydrogenase family)
VDQYLGSNWFHWRQSFGWMVFIGMDNFRHSYRISKAALNQLTKTLSVELGRKGIQVLSLHPGTVDTNLSRPHVKNVKPESLFTPDIAAEKMWKVIEETSHSGVFLDYDAKPIPW